jgi:hypothetical protein
MRSHDQINTKLNSEAANRAYYSKFKMEIRPKAKEMKRVVKYACHHVLRVEKEY